MTFSSDSPAFVNGTSIGLTNAFASTGANSQRYEYLLEIQQMMYVSGEVSNPLRETLMLVEDLVRSQLIEIVAAATHVSTMRNSKSLVPEDILFVIRHAKTMVTRVKSYLSWKDVRRVQKSGNGADAGPGGLPVVGVTTGGAGDDGVDGVLDVDGVIEDGDEASTADARLKPQRNMMPLPWDAIFTHSQCIEEESWFQTDGKFGDDEDDDEREAYLHQMQRLRTADEYTRNMSQEEYIRYTECRQASFSYKRPARFLAWIGINNFVSGKPNSEVVDVLGFLGHEIVQRLAEEALQVKQSWDLIEQDWLDNIQQDAASNLREKATVLQSTTRNALLASQNESMSLRDQFLMLPEFSNLIFKAKGTSQGQSGPQTPLPNNSSSDALFDPEPKIESNTVETSRTAESLQPAIDGQSSFTKEQGRRSPLLPAHILEAERRLKSMWVSGALAFTEKGQMLSMFK